METSTGSQWKTSREVLIFSQTWHGCENPYIGWCIEYGMTKICGLSWGMLRSSFFLLLCFSYPSLPSTAMNTWGPKGLRICCPKHFSCRHHPVLRTIFNVDPCQCPQDRADMIPQCLGVVWNHDSVSPGIQITNPVCHQ